MKRSLTGAATAMIAWSLDNQRSYTLKGCQALDSDEELEAELHRELIELSGTDQHLAKSKE